MAILRRYNALSQERVDVSDVLSIESAVSSDFDAVAQSLITGTANSYVIRGFNILMSNAIGGAASSLNMEVDPGALVHVNASQSGSFFLVPAGTPVQQLNSATNTIVNGAFSPSSTNYVGIDYERLADPTTSAQSYFWSVDSSSELIKNVPKAIVLNFTINISSTVPPTNILPIAKVVTDSGNNVLSITDCRPLLYRLGTGGWNPNPFNVYSWPEGQTEDPITSTSNSSDPFYGGDKSLGSQKDFDDAVASLLQSIIGGPYWYSQNSSGSLNSLREDLGNTLITGKGMIEHSATTAGLINWNQDIFIKVIGSSLSYKLTANPSSTDITLSDNEAAYVTLVRNIVISPNLIFTNGSPVVTSVGSVSWTGPLESGDWIKIGSDPDSNYYEIFTVDSLTQVTLTSNFAETSTGISGIKAKYSFGSYTTSPTPSTNRNIYIVDRSLVPTGQDVFWLFLRSDNGGSPPRVYIRFLSSELSQGESEDISDPISLELLSYIGSPNEAAYAPQYAYQVDNTAVPEIVTIQVGAASTISQNAYFTMFSSGNLREYYVWFNKDAGGTDPAPAGINNSVEVPIVTGQTAAQVATSLMTQLNLTSKEDFIASIVSGHTDTVQITNASAGIAITPANVSTSFTITVTQTGIGEGNFVVQDGDNLTLGIKKLDKELSLIEAMLDDPSYDETIDIVASGATPPLSLNGPIAANTIITLPLNSRLGNAVQKYTVGKGTLQLCLNGIRLDINRDWVEVGTAGSSSNQFQILIPLEVYDAIKCELIVNGGIGSGSGGIGPQGPAGPQGPTGFPAATGPVAYSIKNANYSILTSDCFLGADCTSGSVTLTLPPASSNGGRIFYFAKVDNSGNPLVIAASGSDLIDGSASITLSFQYQARSLISFGSFWLIF
jgi:hypothetical protein